MRRSAIGYRLPEKGGYILREGWFWPEKPCRNGHQSPRNHFRQCVQCIRDDRARKNNYKSEKTVEWERANASRRNELRKEHNRRRPELRMLNAARHSARRQGLPFDLVEADIVIPKVCPVLGIPLSHGSGMRHAGSLSLDRIVPDRGYVRGNVIVVSWRANRIKADATISELRAVADFYEALVK